VCLEFFGEPILLRMMNQITEINFTVNPEAVRSFHDDGVVILQNGRLFHSNETGARIWRGIEQQLPFEAIAKEISSAYQIARNTAREHTLNFLKALEQQSLIKREVAS
jgi:hypothetical protein